MNSVTESWSLPWHALQRRLAVVACGDVNAAVSGASGALPKMTGVAGADSSNGSWLRRAYARARTPSPRFAK